ncbi:hypothetical protein B0H66DRAFT_469667 [Apodospora peruviana]|uniref:UBX domain-containing protein n=1 Tax=Apodospora peruviana TaxID=516989 RepID=A0AAE0MER8_9PEZI|nr:hypothetical protein B0H66DRAFT_469667 [Apodospora peruviana]
MADDERLDAFVGITGASETAGRRMMELCGGDLEQAIQLWFNDEELQRSLSAPVSVVPSTSTSTAPARSANTATSRSRPSGRRTIGREDDEGVIHIDSDDDVQMTDDEGMGTYDSDDAADAVHVARTAQEEEDAAMAQRLQEEMYGGAAQSAGGGADGLLDEDGVRAPIQRTTETLVDPTGFPSGGFAGGFDDDGGQAALLEFRRRRQAQAARPRNPFGQSVWDDPRPVTGPGGGLPTTQATTQTSRSTRLAEMFRPPYEIMSHFTWEEARDEGKEKKKWILVNLQDMSDFNCQVLNRDVWKDQAVSQLVSENFIFLQYEKSDPVAEQYITFYFPNQSHENPSNYPHVSIIDPRTGEQVKVWSGIPFPSASEFHADLAEFLDRYSLSANHKNPVSKAKRPERVVDVDRMTEEEMLQMAMQNSLEANDSGSSLPKNVIDPDELTKLESQDDFSSSDKGKERVDSAETQEATASGITSQASAFSRIPSDRPHVEPAHDPATTTRVQVRNPPSRIIRRFRLDEPVARIYEWLKAEPLPGKEGIEFELKSMPQGTNLIEHLDETIKEACLANGTVMIEFVEE